jgi:hypothetical protein
MAVANTRGMANEITADICTPVSALILDAQPPMIVTPLTLDHVVAADDRRNIIVRQQKHTARTVVAGARMDLEFVDDHGASLAIRHELPLPRIVQTCRDQDLRAGNRRRGRH